MDQIPTYDDSEKDRKLPTIDEGRAFDSSSNASMHETKLNSLVSFIMAKNVAPSNISIRESMPPPYTPGIIIVTNTAPTRLGNAGGRVSRLMLPSCLILGLCFLIISLALTVNSPFNAKWYNWDATGRGDITLIILMTLALVYSYIDTRYPLHSLVTTLLDLAFVGGIISQVVQLISGFPPIWWCSTIFITSIDSNHSIVHDVPGNCKAWLWSVVMLDAFSAGFSVIVSAIYLWRVTKRIVGWKRGTTSGGRAAEV